MKKRVVQGLVTVVITAGMLALAGPKAASLLGIDLGPGTCPACVSVVTTSDTDGSNGLPPHTRLHNDLVANLPYILDVDGPLVPLPLNVLNIGLPGYELGATISAVNADQPTVTLTKLLTAPPILPLRVEVLSGEIGKPNSSKTTFGYDALDSSAPQSFVAALDLTNRDGNNKTTDVFADMRIDTAEPQLSFISEKFTGSAVGIRTNRAIRRLTFRGPNVPTRATLDATTSDDSQHVILTRNARTVADVALIEPNNGPRVVATLDEMPQRVDLTVDETDDGRDLTWRASDIVKRATMEVVAGGTTSRALVVDLPSSVDLTFAADDDNTLVTYGANSRATKVDFTRIDQQRTLNASMDNVPANITKLLYEETLNSGHVDYESDARASQAQVTVTDGPKLTKATLTNVPNTMDIEWFADGFGGRASYDASHTADNAKVEFVSEDGQHVTVDVDQFPTIVDLEYTKTTVGPETSTHVEYTANATVPRVQIDGLNLRGLPGTAKDLHALLEDVPTALSFDTRVKKTETTTFVLACAPNAPCEVDPDCDYSLPDPGVEEGCDYNPLLPRHKIIETSSDDDIAVTASNGRVGLVDVQMTSGPPTRLPLTTTTGRPQDGVLVHDLKGDGSFVLHTRLNGFEKVSLEKSDFDKVIREEDTGDIFSFRGQSRLDAVLDTAGSEHAFTLDKKNSQPGSAAVNAQDARLAHLPAHIELHTFDVNQTPIDSKTVKWQASEPVAGAGDTFPGFMLVESRKNGQEQPVIMKTLTLDPMPSSLRICKLGFGPSCAKANEGDTEGLFDDNVDFIRDGDYNAEELATDYRCFGNGCGSFGMDIHPDDANKGSFVITSDVPTKFDFVDSGTQVHLSPVTRFAFQAHAVKGPCGPGGSFTCQEGYIGIDTAGQDIVGSMLAPGDEGKTNFFEFPEVPAGAEGFHTDRHVWGFHKAAGFVDGEVGIHGPLHCPDGTIIKPGGKEHTQSFCFANLTEFDFF